MTRPAEVATSQGKAAICVVLAVSAALALLVPGRALAQQRVAVLEFAGDGSIEDNGLAFLADMVRESALKYLGSAGYEVMTRENMLVLMEMNTDDLGACEGECEVETGRMIGAHLVVAGSQVKFGSSFELVLRTYETETGRLTGSETVSAETLDALRSRLEGTCARLFGGGGAEAEISPAVGETTVDVGSNVDLAAKAREATRLRAEREELERKEAEIEAVLNEDRRIRREAAEATLRDQAELEWLVLAPLLDTPSAEGVDVAELFVDKYGSATVTVDDQTTPVELARVSEARRWLERHSGRQSGLGSAGGTLIDQYAYRMLQLDPGEFFMGSPDDEEGRGDNETRYGVRLTQAIAVGATEVTQALYAAVMEENPSRFRGDEHPVEQVSWYDAIRFCNHLSEIEGLQPAYTTSGTAVAWHPEAAGYRLPTEAEWEYAARGGEGHVYSGSANIEEVGWYSGNAEGASHPVGMKDANGYVLLDMTGNVAEWVWDLYGPYPTTSVKDPTGARFGSNRVYRGGSWENEGRFTRVASRGGFGPGGYSAGLGFRLVRTLDP